MAAPVPNKMFMIDIETSGVDPQTEEVLQIAIIEMNFIHGYWEKGKVFDLFLHTDRQPTTKFALLHMVDIYKKCNEAPKITKEEVRKKILDFCESCGVLPPNIFFAGWNAGIFDIPFLAHHEYLLPAKYIDDKLVGDCHYRIYEISGALQLIANVKGHNEINTILKEAQKMSPKLEGFRHNALYDCERQMHIINALIRMIRP
ncbi:MAG: exonuclease domain-containing protein [Oligoflexia bacterium]|nr:exonuclease domain-containing protein [Oligoflexia bacterium]